MDIEKLKQLLHIAAEPIAEGAGALIGLAAAGPAGAVVGAAVVPLLERSLKHVIGDYATRPMSDREKWRVGSAIVHAANIIQGRLVAGEKPRDGGYFNNLKDDRSPAETVLEGVLTTCRFQWEERKVPWIANIFVNAAFGDWPPQTVNRVIVLSERMTWRQIYVLALASLDEPGDMPYDWLLIHNPNLPPKQEVLRQEIKDLYAPPFGLLTTDPIGPTSMGRICHALMGLKDFPLDDIPKFMAGD